MKRYFWLIPLVTLTLAGCTSREQADEKLAKGCAAGAELFLTDGNKIKEIRKKSFQDSPEFGSGYREVVLGVQESDGWYDSEQEYKCVFADSLGMFGMGHTASIHQLKVHDGVYGKEGDQILGTYDEHLRLTQTVDAAMSR